MKIKLRKLFVVAMIFMLTFSNIGYTLEAIATSDEFEVITNGFFKKDEIEFNAYFDDENVKQENERISNVNNKIRLTLEITPKVEGYLKEAVIKAVPQNGENVNFRFTEIQDVSTEEIELQSEVDTSKLTNIGDTTLEELETAGEIENEEEIDVVEENEENNTTSNSIVNEISIDSASDKIINELLDETNDSTEENNDEEQLINEEEVIEQTLLELKEANLNSEVEILSENEIKVTNLIEDTTIQIDLEFDQDTQLNIEDLYKTIKLQLSGTYINSDLAEVVVAKEKEVKVGWEYSRDINIASEYTKFSPFKVGETSGTIVENKITVRREKVEEKYLPLKTTTVEIEAPQINGSRPVEVNVQANKLMATKGEEIGNVIFSSDNWSYNENTGIITIIVNNEENGYATNSMGDDEYTISYRYNEYTEQNLNLSKNIKVIAEEYSAKENNILTKTINTSEELEARIGELITYSIGTTDEKINKSKINANYNSVETVYETEYKSTINVNILTSDMLEELKIDSSKEYYIDNNGYEFEATGITYKRIRFQYNDIKDMLEKGGSIEIYSTSGEMLYALNNELIKSEEDCTIEIGGVTGVLIYVKNISVNGNITVELTKAVGKCNYEKVAFKNFTGIESRVTAEVKYADIEETISLQEIGTRKEFEESDTSANISINKENLTTIQENEDVEIKIELNNDEETSDLYVNPCFEIVFPKYVTEVEVESINLIYEDGLVVKNFETYTEYDIVKIRIELEGVQTEFSEGKLTNGTNILVNAKMKLDEYTPKKQDQIRLYYYNEGVTNYESQTKWTINKTMPNGILKSTNGFDVAIVNYQAPTGLIAINGIKNYDGNLSEIKSVKQGTVTQEIARKGNSKIATMEVLTLNNTGNDCSDVVLLGRVPFEGNTDVVTNEDLGTTTDVVIKDYIKADMQNTNSVRIYYSRNEKANKNLNDSTNGWTTDIEDISTIKSYLIVVNGTVTAGEVLRFTYDFEVPNNLPYDAIIAGSFGAYYNNNTDVAIVYQSSIADLVGLTTEAGPKIEATMAVDIGSGANVQECRFLNYTITVANTGSIAAEGVDVKNTIPENTTLYVFTEANGMGDNNYIEDNTKKELSWSIDKLEPSEVQTYTYKVKVDKKSTDNVTIENKAEVSISNLELYAETNTVINKVIDANFDIEIVASDYEKTSVGKFYRYIIRFSNISGKDLEEVTLNDILPEELKYSFSEVYKYNSNQEYDYSKYDYDVDYDENTNNVNIALGNIEAGSKFEANIIVEAVKGGSGEDSEVNNYITLSAKDENTEKSSNVSKVIEGPNLNITQISNLENDYILEGEEVEFVASIQNTGKGQASNLNIISALSSGLDNVEIEYSGARSGKEVYKENENIEINFAELSGTSTIVLKIRGVATDVDVDDEKVITNQVALSADYQDTIYTNTIEIKIKNNPNKVDEIKVDDTTYIVYPENESNENTENSNEEINTGNTDVSTNGSTDTTTDISNSNTATSTTDSENENTTNPTNTTTNQEQTETYSISGMVWLDENKDGKRDDDEKGLSTVKIQLYKSGNMIKAVTTDGNGKYTFSGLSSGSYNIVFMYDGGVYKATSYKKIGVDETVNSDAIETEAGKATSNNVTIGKANVENVDLGMQYKDTFDLLISKYITKAILTTSSGTKEYEYQDLQLAKLEISSKELKSAIVQMEYKIVVENVGNVVGNVAQIVDTLPNGVTFDESKNTGWYLGNDGKVYYEELKETDIEVGEKKEITLVLTKTMTEENTGVVSNKVEIAETSNLLGLKEVSDGNTTSQEFIISVKTGNTVQIVTIIVVLAGMYVLIYMKIKGKIKINNNSGLIDKFKINFSYKNKFKEKKINNKKFYK